MSKLKTKIGAALKANLVAGLTLQAFAVLLALAYYYWPAAQASFAHVAAVKGEYGWKYSLVATAIFGGILPFLYLFSTRQISHRVFQQFLFFTLFWAYRGVEVDLFYQAQAMIFGNDSSVPTIIKKTLFDQLVYGALWAAPSIAVAYRWKECGFNTTALRRSLSAAFWREEVPILIVTNWLIWAPAVAVIYTMPADLQVPMFNLVLCFFVLLVAHISRDTQTSAA